MQLFRTARLAGVAGRLGGGSRSTCAHCELTQLRPLAPVRGRRVQYRTIFKVFNGTFPAIT
jgi:hypothetical protein